MIKRLMLKNFGPYDRADVPFSNFNAIVGENGSGKSFLFTALRCLGRIAKFPLRYPPQSTQMGGYPTRTGQVPFSEIVHCKEIGRTIRLGVEFETATMTGAYEACIKSWSNAGGALVEEVLNLQSEKHGAIQVVVDQNGRAQSSFPGAGRFQTPRFASIPVILFKSRRPDEAEVGQELQKILWDRVGVYRLDPTALKAPAEAGRTLSPTGYGFANYLDEIRNSTEGTREFAALLDRIRMVCPHVKDVLLPMEEQKKGYLPRKHIAVVMSSSSSAIPADLESDGTMLLLAYASLLHGHPNHDVLCIEEPENGVHPGAIPTQVKMLESLSEAHGDRAGAQVLVCTHSKKFFEEIVKQPSTIRLVKRGSDGRSTVETPTLNQLPSVSGWAGLS